MYLCIRACIDHKKKKDYQDANVGERKSTIYKRLKEDAKKAANVVGRALKITKKPKAVIEDDERDDNEESQEDESFTKRTKKVRRALKIRNKPKVIEESNDEPEGEEEIEERSDE